MKKQLTIILLLTLFLKAEDSFLRSGFSQNQRGYIRFDSRANYFRGGTMTYVRIY